MNLPLQNIKIVDFSRLLPGPWCTQFLSDLGAEVIKIEAPHTGDGSRHNSPKVNDVSVYFTGVNGGKKSIALDLTDEGDLAIAQRLIENADVVVESFRPGLAAKLGIGYDTAKSLSSDIVYCSITGFGQTGPLAHISGHDLAIQCQTGVLGVAAKDGLPPQMPHFQAADFAGANVACIGILSALLRRHTTGEGCYLDTSMFDSLFSMSNIALTGALADAAKTDDPNRLEVWGGNPRYAIYGTKDGKSVAVALLEPRLWKGFCHAIGRDDLINENESTHDRLSNHGDLAEVYRKTISDYCLAHTRDDIIDLMEAKGVPITPVLSPGEALHSENVKGRGLLDPVAFKDNPQVPHITNPLACTGLAAPTRGRAPALNGDAPAILADLGCQAEEIKAFMNKGEITS